VFADVVVAAAVGEVRINALVTVSKTRHMQRKRRTVLTRDFTDIKAETVYVSDDFFSTRLATANRPRVSIRVTKSLVLIGGVVDL